MTRINSYVFFDIETTGLPYQEKNQTKITEISMLATLRKDLEITNVDEIPPVSKLTLLFNPQRKIHPYASKITGLTNDLLKFAPVFKDKERSIVSFLEDLPKPVCLVAHNGNTFDFKLLLAECIDANIQLPPDLLCVDSLVGFRKLLKQNPIVLEPVDLKKYSEENVCGSLLTDDEDEWPDLNMSNEDWQEIDDLCSSLSDVSCNELDKSDKVLKTKKSKAINNLFKKSKPRESYTLTSLYEKLLNKKVEDAHRAEVDCLLLLQCVVAKKEFIPWADTTCQKLTAIKPLQR